MIPVRVPAGFRPPECGKPVALSAEHPLVVQRVCCPVCGEEFDAVRAVVLVPVGIPPQNRREQGMVTGGAVPVHAECARGLSPEEAADELSRLGRECDPPPPER